MKHNYHSHTVRCGHASGTEREYIEEAIKGGLKTMGFSDHTPMPFDNGYYSNFRMRPEELEGYCSTLQDLKREYASDIDIRIGLEAEYYPLYFDKLTEFLADYPIEYLLLGQHCLFNEYDGKGSGFPTTDEQDLKQYVKQTCEGMRTGRFLYLAHPDLINFSGNDELYASEMKKICLTAKEMHMPLEINMLGIATERNYPNEKFWKIAGAEGNDVVLGIDCHHTDMVIMPEVEKKGLAIAEKYGLNLLEGPLSFR